MPFGDWRRLRAALAIIAGKRVSAQQHPVSVQYQMEVN
jgi:hypothetical protein